MTSTPPRRKKLFPNPFYVLLLAASTLFVVTALAYLVAPLAEREQAAPGRRAGVAHPAGWLDRHGPMALGIECLVMLVAGGLAMATDDWFHRSSDQA